MIDTTIYRLHLRGFISLLTALSFLIMTVSGIILFITPQGRIAYWLDWSFWGISKTQWGDMHITTSLLFALAGLWHTWLNWRALVSYFQDKIKKTVALKAELVAAAIITVFCTVGGIYKTPPLSYILIFNDYIKESWVKTPEDEPVISHAELLSIKNFLKKVDIELEPALELLKKQGIKVAGPEEKLLDIARNNRTSPSAIYKLLKTLEQKPVASAPAAILPQQEAKKTPPSSTPSEVKSVPPASKTWTLELVQKEFEGKGVGRKTLADICKEHGLDQGAIIKKLAAKKITMASSDTLKKISEERGELPIDVLKVILVGETVR
jgi:succinate dehydrogenase hydrophobic anchor subunit